MLCICCAHVVLPLRAVPLKQSGSEAVVAASGKSYKNRFAPSVVSVQVRADSQLDDKQDKGGGGGGLGECVRGVGGLGCCNSREKGGGVWHHPNTRFTAHLQCVPPRRCQQQRAGLCGRRPGVKDAVSDGSTERVWRAHQW